MYMVEGAFKVIYNNKQKQGMSVKVAVRVRPFNQREKFLGCINCVDMKEGTTILFQNKQKNKKTHYFTFDYSFWSHDEFRVCADGYMEPITEKYIDQARVYDVIGKEMLENAWDGYNCCLFAYGQTGAGKSYSMLGYKVNRGIIPMACEEIFYKIRKSQKRGEKEYEIGLSMLQIYNQKVQDLFVSTSRRPTNGLKVRENKRLGVYVEGLTKHDVMCYEDIEKKMEEGNKHRSLASTLMNEYSSRAHTVVMLEFVQKQWINKIKMNKKTSFINLVDLAGSERVSKTGCLDNKDRLKEASNINKSLHTLGRVIQVLAEHSAGKQKNAQVPYRDSALTRILETALGGNSKTIMICAISPANDNYEQTLSTLRYADQTKKIKNKPIINESAVDKIIRQLREENDRLKRMLQNSEDNSLANSRGPVYQTEKKEMRSNLKASMREIDRQIRKNLKSFAINTDDMDEEDESLMMTEFIDLQQPSDFFSELSFDIGNKAQVYLTNLNQDELLNHKVRYSCEKDLLITNKNNKKSTKGLQNLAKIVLCGLGIEQNHAKIVRKGQRYFIEALSETSADYTLVNGVPIFQPKQLEHNDRIILGINSIFLFKNNNTKTEEKGLNLDYQFAITERQAEMENLAIIPSSTLNLFLPTNFIRDNKSKDIYSGPPTQALNATKKLLANQNQKDIISKISDIESEFDKLVKENDVKMKEKEQFYKNRLSEMRRQKELEREQKSQLEERLMVKSLQSQSLKTKSHEIDGLKKKLTKYLDQKKRRHKVRESMLLDTDDNRIEEDIMGQFVDLEDPNQVYQVQRNVNFGVNYDKKYGRQSKMNVKKDKQSEQYPDLVVQQFQNTEELMGSIQNPRESTQSLLLASIQPIQANKKKKNMQIKEQMMNNELKIKLMEEKFKKLVKLQFRRVYNIKLLSQIDQEIICEKCSQHISQTLSQSNQFMGECELKKYISGEQLEDAELEQFHFKSKQQKKINRIRQEELFELQEQLRLFEAQLVAREARMSQGQKQYQDDDLLNYSMDRRESIRQRTASQRRSSFNRNRLSSLDLQLGQSQQLQKVELKKVVTDFIQVLKDIPQLSIVKESDLKIEPTLLKKLKLNITEEINSGFFPPKSQIKLSSLRIEEMVFNFEGETRKAQIVEKDECLLDQVQQEKRQQKEKFPFQRQLVSQGSNTQIFDEQTLQQRLKGASFTAFLNQQLQSSNQGHQPRLYQKETTDMGIMTADKVQVVDYGSVTQNFEEEREKAEDQDQQIEKYLENQKEYVDIGMGTQQLKIKRQEVGMNTSDLIKKSFGFNTHKSQFTVSNILDERFQLTTLAKKQQQEQNILQKQRNLNLVSGQVDQKVLEVKKDIANSPVDSIKLSQIKHHQVSQFKSDKMSRIHCVDVFIEPFNIQPSVKVKETLSKSNVQFERIDGDRPKMIDQQTEIDQEVMASKSENEEIDSIKRQSNENSLEDEKAKSRKVSVEQVQQFVDKFNLSVSEIAKHDYSYQDISVLGLDGLMKEDQLNNKIKLLEDKIKELQTGAHVKGDKEHVEEKESQSKEEGGEVESAKQENKNQKGPKFTHVKPEKKKKKKKHQMTEQERRQYQIEKELQAKIIQCNNQNILNQRNLQIHKRKRQAEQLRKILIKKEKVQLQKQLLVLIPMVRRFNLIARDMKRLIEGKISIQYRNFSHYEMIQILKNYSINKKSSGDNIQIRIVVLNCQEGRLYTWPADVFKNRYEIAEQIFQKYLQCQDDEIGKNRILKDRTEKSKDPFWDPVEFVGQGVGYLSMQVLLYNLSYQGYISLVYKSSIVAKLYISIAPVKVRRYNQDDSIQDNDQTSDLQNIQIGNHRNLFQKQMYFSISIESIRFMKNEQKHKMDQTSQQINLNSINSNIMRYSISYELIEDEYKLNTYTTPEIDFVEDKQFKRIDYMRRHCFKNISQSTLAYISDCPIKVTLNVMKDYNQEVLNASFNQEYEDSENNSQLQLSGFSDSKSVHSKKSSGNSVSGLPTDIQIPKSDFSKKKGTAIFENTDLVSKWQTDAKNIEQKHIKEQQQKLRRQQELKRKATKQERDKEKDKDCLLY